jgi:hypothetical protein
MLKQAHFNPKMYEKGVKKRGQPGNALSSNGWVFLAFVRIFFAINK